jgi:hypothetical protein
MPGDTTIGSELEGLVALLGSYQTPAHDGLDELVIIQDRRVESEEPSKIGPESVSMFVQCGGDGADADEWSGIRVMATWD